MNAPIGRPAPEALGILPPQFEALCPSPQLLPGENVHHYRALQAAIFRDINPQSAIEWLLAIDIAELSWEIRRYQVLRHRLLSAYRQKAVEMTLRRLDLTGIAPDMRALAEFHTARNAQDWQLDPSAAIEIEARLRSYGFDQNTLNMEVYIQASEPLSMFEALLDGARLRRLLLIKEINQLKRTSKNHSNSGSLRRLS